jgi:hypothetical protein
MRAHFLEWPAAPFAARIRTGLAVTLGIESGDSPADPAEPFVPPETLNGLEQPT